MELRQVQYAVAVIDHDGFTRAAAALYVSQPSLSQGVANLETELGTPLFHRVGRRVVLTPAGEAFQEPARQLLRDARTIRDIVGAVAGLQAGRLDLVALPTLAVEPAARLVAAFRRAVPLVAVRLVEPEDSEALLAMVRDGRSELGFTEVSPGNDLESLDLGSQEILAVCPPGTRIGRGNRLPVARLASMALVATPPGTSTRRLVDEAMASADIRTRIAVETDQREAILPLVLGGAGTTFLPAPLAAEAGRRGAIIASLDPPLVRRVGIVHRSGPLSPAATAFLELASAGTDDDVPPAPFSLEG
jgi:DNA-binding transcriptional LysR family regulator